MYSIGSNVFGIATALRTGRSGDPVPVRARVSFLLQMIMTDCGAHTAAFIMGTGSFLEVKRSELEFNISLPSSWEVKNEYSYISSLQSHNTPYGPYVK